MGKKLENLSLAGASDVNKKKALAYAIEARKSEIDRFWSRTIVFWGFVAATFVAYGTLYDKVRDTDPVTILILSCFGLLSSIAWSMQGRGSKYWQEAWENKVAILEKDVLRIELFSNQEPVQRKLIWGARRFSVSRLTIALSDLACLVWLGLGWKAYVKVSPGASASWGQLWQVLRSFSTPDLILIATVVFFLALLTFCRSRNSN